MKKIQITQKEINDAMKPNVVRSKKWYKRNVESDEAKDLINEYCDELTDKDQPEACNLDTEDCEECGS
jgi:hypothetical protein